MMGWLVVSVVYDALSLARRPGDKIEKEYKVDPLARRLKLPGKTMDVVYIQQQQVLYYCTHCILQAYCGLT